jgi:hypothetical protein
MSYSESRANRFLFALGLRKRFPGPRDAWRLRDLLGDELTIRQGPKYQLPQYRPRRDGGGIIELPVFTDPREEAFALLEEIGHKVCNAGPIAYYRRGMTREEERLEVLRELADEREAERFTDAFWLPAPVVRTYLFRPEPDWDGLLWDSGCDRKMVERRCKRLMLRDFGYWSPHDWSAWRHYIVRRRRTAEVDALRLSCKEGLYPDLEFAVTPATFADVQWRIHADLFALRPDEFRRKHHAAVVDEEYAGLVWDEFLGIRHEGRVA